MKITVEIDTREKYPLLFPANLDWAGKRHQVVQERIKLDAGDYRLKEIGNLNLVERKGSPGEIWQNLFTDDSGRQHRALRKLVECSQRRCILLDFSLVDVFNFRAFGAYESGQMLDRLLALAQSYKIDLIWSSGRSTINSRRRLGELVLRYLLVGFIEKEPVRLV